MEGAQKWEGCNWGLVERIFYFPPGYDKEKVKEHAKHIMGLTFINFKGEMNNLVQEVKELD